MTKMVTLKVTLNGTDTNPYAKYGFKYNPFPQLGKREYDALCLRVQALGGEPIRDLEDLRKRLEGFDNDFIELCCSKFEKGHMVTFFIEFPEGS